MNKKQEVILKALGLDIEGKELTAEEIGKLFKNFREVKKTLDEYEKKTLKPYFFKAAEELGDKTENGGHRVVLEDGTGWEKQARVSVKVDEDAALTLLKNKHLTEFITKKEFVSEDDMEKAVNVLKSIDRPDLITTEETVEESALEQAYYDGHISDEELSEIVTRKVSYALVEVKPKK